MAGGSQFGNSDTAVGLQGGMYNPQSTGYTGRSAQAGGVVTDPKALAGYQQAFNKMFQPLLSKGYTQQQITQYLQTLPGPQSAKIQEQLDSATNSILNPDSTLDKVMQGLALAGSAIGVGLLTGGAIAPALSAAGADAAGSAGALAGNAAAGAIGGGFTSGLEGQSIGKGALLGGVGGALGSAAAPAAESLSGSTGLPAFASSGLVKAGVGAATSAAAGSNPLIGAIGGGASGLASGLNTGLGGNAITGIAAGAAGNQIAKALTPSDKSGSSMGNINPGASGAQPSQGAQGAQGNSGNMAVNPQTYSMGNVGGATVSSTAPSMQAYNLQAVQAAPSGTTPAAPASTDSTLAGTITGALPGVLQGAAGVYGAQNAAQAQQNADNSAINTQQNTQGNINGIWNTQQQTGQGANTALQSSLGLGGKPADPSNFLNMPGYQFAVQQGTQAIQRQAAAMGSAYTPNTAEAVGQYVTGTASQDYNTYIQQLMGAAGLGSTANQGLQTSNLQTGANISQLQQNIGQAQASGVTSAAGAVGGIFGVNGAGTSLVGAAGRALTGGTSGGNGNGSGVSGGNSTGMNSTNAPISGSSPANYGGQNPNGTGGNGTASDPYGANSDLYSAINGPTSGDISNLTSGAGNIDMSGLGDAFNNIDTSNMDLGNLDLGNIDSSFSSDATDWGF